MKTLHIIRHAKSSWADPQLADIDRPLNNRGIRSCQTMAEPILAAGCDFANTFCSPARRAQLTIEGIAAALPSTVIDWQVDPSLYTFDGGAVLHWGQSLDESIHSAVVVGHNPALTDFCNHIGDQYIDNLPTCGYIQLRCMVDRWSELSAQSAQCAALLTPKTVTF